MITILTDNGSSAGSGELSGGNDDVVGGRILICKN